jgi:hypothetical protein
MIQELIYRAAIAFPWILVCTYLLTSFLISEWSKARRTP